MTVTSEPRSVADDIALRDLFASAAVTGLLLESDCVTAQDWKPFAVAAYGLADALMEARKRNDGE